MAWFVVQKKGERAQMVIDRKLLDVIYGAPAEVTVKGFRSYEAAKCAAKALEDAVQAHPDWTKVRVEN